MPGKKSSREPQHVERLAGVGTPPRGRTPSSWRSGSPGRTVSLEPAPREGKLGTEGVLNRTEGGSWGVTGRGGVRGDPLSEKGPLSPTCEKAAAPGSREERSRHGMKVRSTDGTRSWREPEDGGHGRRRGGGLWPGEGFGSIGSGAQASGEGGD